MELTLLGTGSATVSTERFGPAQVIRHGTATILVDCGSGVVQRLLGAGLSGAAIDAIILTHLHSDHVMDLFQVIVSSWLQGRSRPQRVLGPPGTRGFVEALMRLWRDDLRARVAQDKSRSTKALTIEVTELGRDATVQFGDLKVEVIPVDHPPLSEAFGYRFVSAQGAIVLSGDTRPCRALIDRASGADILIHEVAVAGPDGNGRIAAGHTPASQVGRVAAEADVGCLVLSHFDPPSFNRRILLQEVRATFDGPLIIGEDLMVLNPATGIATYRGVELSLRRRTLADAREAGLAAAAIADLHEKRAALA